MRPRTGLTGIVVSLVFFAIGAVLHYALHVAVTGVDYPQIGLIIMIIAAVGFVLSCVGYLLSGTRRRTETHSVVTPQGTAQREETRSDYQS
jgi:hypothetical protein